MTKLYVIGLGPGSYEDMTMRAEKALASCDVIAGYTVYVDLIRDYYPDKEFLTTPMTKEEERCRLALETASAGKTTAMVCSGDAGVYGMAGLIFSMGKDYPQVEVDVSPRATAALPGAALLGAPLIHDFVLISLSDLLTPWETIEKRLRCAAQADFVICLYNPSSRKRADYLKKACRIIEEYQSGDTVCGYAANIGREGETYHICTLRELEDARTDMFTTVFIGNSQTRELKGHMITPRGYENG